MLTLSHPPEAPSPVWPFDAGMIASPVATTDDTSTSNFEVAGVDAAGDDDAGFEELAATAASLEALAVQNEIFSNHLMLSGRGAANPRLNAVQSAMDGEYEAYVGFRMPFQQWFSAAVEFAGPFRYTISAGEEYHVIRCYLLDAGQFRVRELKMSMEALAPKLEWGNVLQASRTLQSKLRDALPDAINAALRQSFRTVATESRPSRPVLTLTVSGLLDLAVVRSALSSGDVDSIPGTVTGRLIEELAADRDIQVQFQVEGPRTWKQRVVSYGSLTPRINAIGDILVGDRAETMVEPFILAAQERLAGVKSTVGVRAHIRVNGAAANDFLDAKSRRRLQQFVAASGARSKDVQVTIESYIPRWALQGWYDAPSETSGRYKDVYKEISLTIQLRLRDWLLACWRPPSKQHLSRTSELLLHVYNVSETSVGRARNEIAPEWMTDNAGFRVFATGLPEACRIHAEKLGSVSPRRWNCLRARRAFEHLIDSHWCDYMTKGLLHFETTLINTFINLGIECRSLDDAQLLSRARIVSKRLTHRLRRIKYVLMHDYAAINYSDLLPMLLLDATNALNFALHRNYLVTTFVTLTAPDGSCEKFENQSAIFSARSHYLG